MERPMGVETNGLSPLVDHTGGRIGTNSESIARTETWKGKNQGGLA